jgi:hypothetical protein
VPLPSSTDSINTISNPRRHACSALVVFATASLLIFRLFWVVNRYSVNLFFFDEWDIYGGLFRGWPWWRFFLQEHGPHRQGLGVTVVVGLLQATHWDSRFQSYAIAGAIVLAMFTAIRIRISLYGLLRLSDVIIPVLFLGLGQWEVLLSAPGPSAQAFPLLLLMLYCLSWAQEKTWLRYTGVVILNFLLIYTGYGIFISVLTLLLLAIDCWQKRKTRGELIAPLAALIGSALSFASFFYKYVFNPAADCFHFPYRNPAAYPWFMAMMLARYLGIKHGMVLPSLLGLVALGVLLPVCGRSLRVVMQRMDRANVVVLILTGYSLIYATAAAIGRVCMGIEAAQSSRNLTLLIPGFVGIYFCLLNLNPNRNVRILIAVMLLSVLPACIQRNHKEIEGFSAMKTAWKNCYLTNGNVAYCDEASHLQLYPHPNAIHLDEKLAYLKENHLNLYENSR